ncbi:hypothetical protein [Sphingomonas sp. ERG5]|uniref:hypothetical protein n=1 Tax=Sphingomonas sp. ERG5 TaxID=1381597 RepID=UPI001F1CCF88|nr:hypothetical protein [Sphingomonas sp. ERG5]
MLLFNNSILATRLLKTGRKSGPQIQLNSMEKISVDLTAKTAGKPGDMSGATRDSVPSG